MSTRVEMAPSPAGDMRVPTGIRLADSALVVGGLLWLPYGAFEFLAPWGVDAVYDEGRGYEVVIDRLLFTAYTAPGAAALLLTALGTMNLLSRLRAGRRSRRFTVLVLWLAVTAAVVSFSGVVTAWDPMATGGRVLGSLLLGIGTVAAAAAAARDPLAPVLLLSSLGALGLFLLPLWPLVYAVEVVPAIGGASVLATYGLGWVILGVTSTVKARLIGISGPSRARRRLDVPSWGRIQPLSLLGSGPRQRTPRVRRGSGSTFSP